MLTHTKGSRPGTADAYQDAIPERVVILDKVFAFLTV